MAKIIYNITMCKEIKQSSLTLAGIIVLLFAFYSALPETKSRKSTTYGTKTVEEIIADSYTKDYKQDTAEWDSSFKSAIIPIKE